jgi:hypothetical protein
MRSVRRTEMRAGVAGFRFSCSSRAQDPKDAIGDTTVVSPRNATRPVRQHGIDGNPSIIGEFVAHDSSPQFGSLNQRGLAGRNASGQALIGRLRGRSGHQPADNLRLCRRKWPGAELAKFLPICVSN